MRQNRRGTFSGKQEDRTAPHLVLIHEDPQLSGKVFYSLATGEIHIGRKNGDPVPQIILGSIGIKPNHAKIKLQENGLFEFSVCDAEAALNTMVNGKNLPKKRSKILNHLDRLAFAGGIIYVFHYPLLSRGQKKIVEQNASENEGLEIALQLDQAWAIVQESGIPDFTGTACPDYEFGGVDAKAIDWDKAFSEVEEGEKAKNQKLQKEQLQKFEKDKKKAQQEMDQ